MSQHNIYFNGRKVESWGASTEASIKHALSLHQQRIATFKAWQAREENRKRQERLLTDTAELKSIQQQRAADPRPEQAPNPLTTLMYTVCALVVEDRSDLTELPPAVIAEIFGQSYVAVEMLICAARQQLASGAIFQAPGEEERQRQHRANLANASAAPEERTARRKAAAAAAERDRHLRAQTIRDGMPDNVINFKAIGFK